MPLPPDKLDALVQRREAEARAAAEAEVARIIALPTPAKRMQAYSELVEMLAKEGEKVPPDLAKRILRSLQADPPERTADQPAASSWAAERRRLARMFLLRPVAVAGCAVAAVAPFAVAPVRWGWTAGDTVSVYLGVPWGLLGMALAIAVACVAAGTVARAKTVEGLAWRVVASFATGVVGLGVALH